MAALNASTMPALPAFPIKVFTAPTTTLARPTVNPAATYPMPVATTCDTPPMIDCWKAALMPTPVTAAPLPATCPKLLAIPLANPLEALIANGNATLTPKATTLAKPTVNPAATYPMPVAAS